MSLTGRGRFRGVRIVPQTPDGLLRAFEFDAVLGTSENNPGQMTRHPIQRGAEGITDAVQLGNRVLSCSGVNSDTPARLFTVQRDRAITAYQLLKDIRDEAVPVTVFTSWLPMLTNMWPTVVDGARGPSTGAAIEISITFGRFRFVTTQLVPSIIDSDVHALGLATLNTSF